ncbi:hypothetical protein MOJ79_04565 [Calidifontimicrobium sp. SYSU G02091]|uniref:hypothetical protein n=1 Tax=Calidifontimicrobium sp. SYSU G02091 TaxID=2926421 RepID=UPI001F53D53A|nr:hypothetical protein [Calidifontimicrobium sp. SYSU G02091]MCI1191108.1 hypothetical protein [Calidifontimicrobium sp. SYSU G02091]
MPQFRGRRIDVRRRLGGVWIAALSIAVMFAGCGGGGGGGHDHDDRFIDTAGRLVVAEQDATTLRIYDLDDTSWPVAAHALEHPPSAVYASPGGRYAVVVQRLQDQVQFVDGGIWQEDHGDHLHDYKRDSRPMAWRLQGPRPTHYDVQSGVQAAVFFDGDAASAPVRTAAVRLITDDSIGRGSVVAGLDLTVSIHGLAEPWGDWLLTVHRAADASTTLPTHLEQWRRQGAGYSFIRRIDEVRCEGMHGSFTTLDRHTVVGCQDGVLVATTGADGSVQARHVPTPIRIGTIAGHPRLAGHVIGIGNAGSGATATTRFFAIDAAAGVATELVIQDLAEGVVRRAHGFDRSGQRFFVLDSLGRLHQLVRDGPTWRAAGNAQVVAGMPTAAPWPAISANGARDVIYLSDPVARQLVSINAHDGTVLERRDLGYVPSAIVWLGIWR